eukprot:scaffold818_cov136-Cylindrotheca_fusiformis.AAC.27
MSTKVDEISGDESQRPLMSTNALDFCLDWVVFPSLIFIQFGATMYCQMKEGTLTMDWRVVHVTIFLFCLVGGIYRQVVRRHSWNSLGLLLLPELFTNITLGVVIFRSLEEAFICVVVFTGALSFLGLIAAGQALLFEKKEEATDYQLLSEHEGVEDEWIC